MYSDGDARETSACNEASWTQRFAAGYKTRPLSLSLRAVLYVSDCEGDKKDDACVTDGRVDLANDIRETEQAADKARDSGCDGHHPKVRLRGLGNPGDEPV